MDLQEKNIVIINRCFSSFGVNFCKYNMNNVLLPNWWAYNRAGGGKGGRGGAYKWHFTVQNHKREAAKNSYRYKSHTSFI